MPKDRHSNRKITLRLEPELLERLKYVSYLGGQPVSDVIKHCLKTILPHLEAMLEKGDDTIPKN